MPSDISVDKVIKAYISVRAQKDAIEAKAKADVEELKAKLGKFEAWLQAKADETGVKSFKTDYGTAFLTTSDFANVADWDAVLNFIKTNDAYDMLERRVSKTAVRSYLDANKAVPDGVTFGTRISISVRKPAAKVE